LVSVKQGLIQAYTIQCAACLVSVHASTRQVTQEVFSSIADIKVDSCKQIKQCKSFDHRLTDFGWMAFW